MLVVSCTGLTRPWLAGMLDRLNASVSELKLATNASDVSDRPRPDAPHGSADVDRDEALQIRRALGEEQPEIVFFVSGRGEARLLEVAREVSSVRVLVIATLSTAGQPHLEGSVSLDDGDAAPILVNVRATGLVGPSPADRPAYQAVRDPNGGTRRRGDALEPSSHVMDPLRLCLLLAEQACAALLRPGQDLSSGGDARPGFDFTADRPRAVSDRLVFPFVETGRPPRVSADALLPGWRPMLSPEESVSWMDEWIQAASDGHDVAPVTLDHIDRYLGQCVRLTAPGSPLAASETATATNVEAHSLRTEILNLVERYHAVAHRPAAFDPARPSVPVSGRVYGSRDMQVLVDSALDFWLTTGRFNAAFEKRLAKRVGVRHALTVNSGSSANLVAFSALTSPKMRDRRLTPGDEVITCATGFPTTINPVLHWGMVPVFVDVDFPTYNINVAAVEAAVTPRTRAIMVAHTLGNPFDVAGIRAICDRHGLFLVEDCCDALGATVGGRHVGTFGDVGTLSFYPAHHITMGEGGAVFTNDSRLNKIMESFRDWGRDCYCDPGCDNTCNKRYGWQLGDLPKGYDHKYVYSHLGFNLKITDMQAAVGLAQLDHLEGFIERRRSNFDALYDGLRSLEDLFVLPEPTPGTEPSWFGFPLTLRDDIRIGRDDLVKHLNSRGIGTRLLFGGNLVRQPYMKGRDFRVSGSLANADRVVERTFWIGVYPGIGTDAVNHVLDTLTAYCRGVRRAVLRA